MGLAIVMPVYDTLENNRGDTTCGVLERLGRVKRPQDKVVVVWNGGDDERALEYALESDAVDCVLDMGGAHPIADAVNEGWWLYEGEIWSGELLATKFDSDIEVCPDIGWQDEIERVLRADEDVWLAGVMNGGQEYTGRWVIEDHGFWYEVPFVYGGVQVRSPECFRRIGYSKQPYGRWGWGDHWDTRRVEFAGKKLAVTKKCQFVQRSSRSSITSEEKSECMKRGRDELLRMLSRLRSGELPLFQEKALVETVRVLK